MGNFYLKEIFNINLVGVVAWHREWGRKGGRERKGRDEGGRKRMKMGW